MDGKRVIVGMSGGIDSSVAALLLKEQGYDVTGVFMKNWDESDSGGGCSAERDYDDMREVCQQIDIPYYSVNFSKNYWDSVFTRFLHELKAGYTPNPDIWCNQEIKFSAFFEKALALGADYVATGHYCRIVDSLLYRGVDTRKDQSYFLYTLGSDTLSRAIFPLGGLQKSTVKEIAAAHDLAVCGKKESMGICFIGKRNFKEFLGNYIDLSSGNIETFEGKVVGQHDGVAFYTIGQRKGLGIGGPGEPWFVVDKDVDRNVLVVTQGGDDPSLFHGSIIADDPRWVREAPQTPFRCTAKVRYRQDDVPCTIVSCDDATVAVDFDEPCRAVTPGQSIVFYDGERCCGGAVIRQRA